ncbi:SMI1/KNR4 family protein [Streptomyces sp. NPDC002346]
MKEAFGIALPADYKRLVQTHGGGLFAGVLSLLEPGCPDAMYDLVAQTAEREEIVAELWDAGEEKPSELHEGNASPAPRGTGDWRRTRVLRPSLSSEGSGPEGGRSGGG